MRVQSLSSEIVRFFFVLLAFLIFPSIGGAENITLQKPAVETTNFLEAEAGISAYTNVQQAVDLKKAKNAFRTIEHQTEDYIVGSVPLLDYGEEEDIHAYVHKTGWILAYYLCDEPAAKIVDWKNYGQDGKIYGTKLETGLSVLCSACQVAAREVKYYDFRCPEANKLLIVADAAYNVAEDSFTIKIPNEFLIFERSYLHCNFTSARTKSALSLDSTVISVSSLGMSSNYGILSPVQLSVDDFHIVKLGLASGYAGNIESLCAIVLVYREP